MLKQVFPLQLIENISVKTVLFFPTGLLKYFFIFESLFEFTLEKFMVAGPLLTNDSDIPQF